MKRRAEWAKAASLAALLVFVVAGCGRETRAPATPPQEKKGTRLILLGTGNPNADPARSGPATAIVVNDAVYIIDCGPGVVRRAAAAGIAMPNLTRLFVTHLHSDHTLGYPDLVFSPWTLERTEPLEVYGPPGIKAMTSHILEAYKEDVAIRTNGLEPANTTGYQVNAHEIQPGVIYRDANVTVKAFRVPHGSVAHAFGFRFETPDRTIVISGDTTFTPEMITQARGADILVHEVYCEACLTTRPPEWQKYHRAFHTSSRDLARIANEAKPGLLVLSHFLVWAGSEEQLLKEIHEIYKGPVVAGKDLQVF